MSDVVSVLIQVTGLIAAGTAAIIAGRKAPSETRKTEADADLSTAEASNIIIKNLTDEVHRLEVKIEEERKFFQKQISELQRENSSQRHRLMKLEEKLKEPIT